MPGFPLPMMHYPDVTPLLTEIFGITSTVPGYSNDDGVTWNNLATSVGGTAVIYSPTLGRIVVLGNSTSMAYSDDNGVTWTTLPTALPNAGTGQTNWQNGVWIPDFGGRFVIANEGTGTVPDNSNFAYSADGITWTAVTYLAGQASMRARSIAYADDVNRLAVFMSRDTGTQRMAYSDDGGVTWINGTATFPSNQGQMSLSSNGSSFAGIWWRGSSDIARGYSSGDGITWTTPGAFAGMNVSATSARHALSYCPINSLYLGVFGIGHVVTFNGSTWTVYLLKLPNYTWAASIGLEGIGRFVAFASAGATPAQRIAYSDDAGVTWNYTDPGATLVFVDAILTL